MGTTLEFDFDTRYVKNFTRINKERTWWEFSPKVGNEGIYNMSLKITMIMKGHPSIETEFKFKVTILNDAPLIQKNNDINKDEHILY
jgi:hypothetical protein